jgi:hypothetical protein
MEHSMRHRQRFGLPVAGCVLAAVLSACAGATADDVFAVRLLQPLPFADGVEDGSVSKGDIPDLMRRPVAKGSDPGIDGVRLTSKDGDTRTARTCEDYLGLVRSGWFADTGFDAARESAFNFTCVTLAFLVEATPPDRSFIAAPAVGVGDIALLPANVLPAPVEAERRRLGELAAGGGTVADQIDPAAPTTTIARHQARYTYRGVEQVLTELARADFNGDGVEDILVFVDESTPGGPYRAAYHIVLTRTAADGPFSLLSDR